jgi:hypothetical protein
VQLCPVDRITTGFAARSRASFCEGTGDGIFGLDFADGRDGVYISGVGRVILSSNDGRNECKKKERKE